MVSLRYVPKCQPWRDALAEAWGQFGNPKGCPRLETLVKTQEAEKTKCVKCGHELFYLGCFHMLSRWYQLLCLLEHRTVWL
jgi:hypothetical protein